MPSTTAKQASCAYLAGFIDGEGSITITEHKRSDRPGYVRRNVRLQVYNTNYDILVSIQSEFGGVIYTVRCRTNKWKDQFSLVWSEKSLVPILVSVLPYLRLKKRQAEIAIEYQNMKMPASAGRRNGQPSDNVIKMTELFTQLRKLNKRGTDAVEDRKAG